MNSTDVKRMLDEYVGTPPADPFDVDQAIRRGRRRRSARTAFTWTAALIAVAVLAGSALVLREQQRQTAPVAPAPAPFSLDGGGLAVTPVTARDTSVPAERAFNVLALQAVYVTSMTTPVLATVRWSAKDVGTGPTTLALQQGALAWVLTYQTRVGQSCGGYPSQPPSPTTPGSDTYAVIVDAATGRSAIYFGSRQSCYLWTKPTIQGAARYVSLPWVVDASSNDAPKPFAVTVPGCAALTGSWSDDFKMTMIGAEPLDGSCSGPSSTHYDEGSASPGYATHAPTGLLCAGHDPTVALPRPKDCVASPIA